MWTGGRTRITRCTGNAISRRNSGIISLEQLHYFGNLFGRGGVRLHRVEATIEATIIFTMVVIFMESVPIHTPSIVNVQRSRAHSKALHLTTTCRGHEKVWLQTCMQLVMKENREEGKKNPTPNTRFSIWTSLRTPGRFTTRPLPVHFAKTSVLSR